MVKTERERRNWKREGGRQNDRQIIGKTDEKTQNILLLLL